MKIAICHPELLPAVPFFKRIMAADLCVLLGHAPFDLKGPVCNLNYGGSTWKMRVDDKRNFIVDRWYTHYVEDWAKIVRDIGHPMLKDVTPLVESSVWITNRNLIQYLCKRLGVTTPVVADEPVPLHGTDRLIHLCRRHRADTFLAMEGSYVDEAQFKAARLNVEFFTPHHTEKQHVLDLL